MPPDGNGRHHKEPGHRLGSGGVGYAPNVLYQGLVMNGQTSMVSHVPDIDSSALPAHVLGLDPSITA
jgi:hypothetical protein